MINFYERLSPNQIKCLACNRFCVIEENQVGFCRIRKNVNGSLVLLTDNKPVAVNVDAIEKKPLYHFLEKTKTLSLGTLGCNFNCLYCQNHNISRFSSFESFNLHNYSADDLVSFALNNKIPSISYTYTEPSVFVEYALRVMKLARENGLKNIWVSNGYFSDLVLDSILPYLDAINIDIKGSQKFYDELVGGADLSLIKKNIKRMYESGVHLEITTLLIEGYNTSDEDIKEIVDFVASLSLDIPLHFSRAFPFYKLKDIKPTKLRTLKKAEKIARERGLKNVYLGNI